MAFDLCGQLSFTSAKGKSTHDSLGGILNFDTVNSARTRIGGRFNFTETAAGFAGLAWECDFGDKAGGAFVSGRGKVYNPACPDFSGSSGYAELGLKISAGDNAHVQIEGYGLAGQSKGGGVAASLIATF